MTTPDPSTANAPLATAPFADWVGIAVQESGEGAITLTVQQRPELNNRWGIVHGGVIATLADSAMARAVRLYPEVKELLGTVDLHLQYVQPATGALTAHARVEEVTRSLAFCRCDVRNAQGHTVALAQATIKLRRTP